MDVMPKALAGLQTWKLVFIAAFAGALSVLAMAPFFLWPIMFITFPVLIWTLDAIAWHKADAFTHLPPLRKGRAKFVGWVFPFRYLFASIYWIGSYIGSTRFGRAAFVGWGFGFGYFLAGTYWIGYAFYVDADRYAVLMPPAVAGLAAALGLFYAIAAALASAFWRRGYARILAFVFAFFCAEAARGYLFTGFPWNLFGEALAANDAHMQMAAYIGVYGLTLAALFIFSAPAAAIAMPEARFAPRWAPIVCAVLALAASYAFGNHRLREVAGEVEGVRVRIVQPNIPQTEKWKRENRNWIFERAIELSRKGTSGEDIAAFSHIIWPESSVPVLFHFNGGIFSVEVKDRLAALIPPNTSLVLGAERAEGELSPDGRYRFDRFFNSLFVLGEGAGISAIYDKTHLVPFGEYVPFQNVLTLAGFRAFSHRLDGFDSGEKKPSLINTLRGPAFLPLICYEIIFPGRVENVKRRPEWIVNVTNDAWFGASTGPYQHLHQARIRAVEEGLPVIRAANTGVSAVIDPFGRVLAKLDLDKAGALDHGLPRALPITFYEKTRLPVFIALFLFPLQFYLIMVAFGKVG